ncbi:MAG: hypothetical protein ACREKS_09840 [Candidatus Rokuibacteriota bacterium]
MRWRVGLVIVLVAGLPAATTLAADDSRDDVQEVLAEARTQLLDSIRAYRVSLERLMVLQDKAAARAEQEASGRLILLARGMVSRREAEESAHAATASRERLEQTRERLAETDAILAETLAAIELARSAPASVEEVVARTPRAIGATGNTDLTAPLISGLDQFFRQRFARALPVSARGQTLVHDRLGLDHHHAVDVTVHPDSAEGQALIEQLRLLRVPFLAFRSVLPGSSTGAHLHIGRASRKLVPGATGAAGSGP